MRKERDADIRARVQQHWEASEHGDVDVEHAIYAADAILEAIDAGCKLVVCITEGIPVMDMIKVRRVLEATQAEEASRGEALTREAEHAQLLALRSHLDPHFLFNTLNAIAEWCRSDGLVAEKAILQLSSMLRTMMTGIQETGWPLAKELELPQELALDE